MTVRLDLSFAIAFQVWGFVGKRGGRVDFTLTYQVKFWGRTWLDPEEMPDTLKWFATSL